MTGPRQSLAAARAPNRREVAVAAVVAVARAGLMWLALARREVGEL